jgi:ubiquinone/menaquinone biosynthesis C-methylase UbiE
MAKNWDASEQWYTSCVGEKGHYYHQAVVLPNVLRLLGKYHSILDLGCGQGVLARHIPETIEYVGVDLSKALIASAKKMTKKAQFFVADATCELPIQKKDFDRCTFILSLQNMERGQRAIQTAARHVKKGGKLLIVLNHPAFRIPRQSSWGIDEQMKLQYRKVNCYMTPQEIPIQTNPGKGDHSETTFSYHHPLSTYCSWLHEEKFLVESIEEWCSDKKSEGARAKMEDRARREIPLFLAISAVQPLDH